MSKLVAAAIPLCQLNGHHNDGIRCGKLPSLSAIAGPFATLGALKGGALKFTGLKNREGFEQNENTDGMETPIIQ